MSRNYEEKAVSVVSFISSSLWYIDDFSITDERKITNVAERKHTKQTIGSFIAWISTEFSYISLHYRLLHEYPHNIVVFRYFTVYCVTIYRIYLYFVTVWKFAIFYTLSCLNSNVVYNDQFKYKCVLFFAGMQQNINTLCQRIKTNEIQHI